ncbi:MULTISPECIES: TetR/AcrR family transcriptional regulator [Exiguobacterium]|uniref:TetR/AcrR family transcriptional regulator n=1 Tax=Exiguobacterium mexicanum TaxID=340146 RepID=A0ABT7MT77_9BACL|nr:MULTISPECIES: TetR/AcrR family transcriptional regulator [Exiguobacterium]MDL5378389.1 TetR/AcrR family transcriptional regulator [Exiguobacterium mexicanum]QUE86305.1 TetR/AcrR family transcriptional regulator [Exiguobacterium alkaliphilum]TCI67493.1 TetR/AcrR family transcriptional regulator [Exiguobacterium sp. IPCI3]TCI76831.1 TetR/AcrR family transcriptional regulator [Exiguobacterium sp. IPCH1]TCI78576.1 TetR/AcrR family transcriptional regulator [Exiguobacterium sp. IPBC4]
MKDKKRKVADVAMALFIENGVQQTSVQEIIERANISKGTFYNYFASKTDCVANILENLRYDAGQRRIEMQMGRDKRDKDVFIEQISILIQLNEERNLHALFESIMSANEPELKKLVLQHRVYEIEWLAMRLTEIIGEEIRPYSVELTVLFNGMLQHILFTLRITNTAYSIQRLIRNLYAYVELMAARMVDTGEHILNPVTVDQMRGTTDKNLVTKDELIGMAARIHEHVKMTEEQADLFEAITYELHQDRLRKIVLEQLLKPFQRLFKGETGETEVQKFTNLVWLYTRTH